MFYGSFFNMHVRPKVSSRFEVYASRTRQVVLRPLGTSTNCKHYLALFSTNPIKGTFPQVIAVGEHHNEGEKSLSYRSHLHRIYELMNDSSVWLLTTIDFWCVLYCMRSIWWLLSLLSLFFILLGALLWHVNGDNSKRRIPITKIKHTYQYHASRFALIQRRTRKFYFASDCHTQTVIHVY